jgi:hypothetical protein
MKPASSVRFALKYPGVAIACGLIVLRLIPFAALEHAPVVCMYRNLLGHPCPTCGLTRAMSLLLRSDFAGAAFYNPLAFAVLPSSLAIAIRDLGLVCRRLYASISGAAKERPCALR